MVRSWKEGVCQSTALSPGWECLLKGLADACAPPGHSSFPGPAWLCFPPLGSISWLRMPGLLRMVLRQDTGDGRGQDCPAGGFAQRHSASSLVGLPGRAVQALQSQPCPALASLSSHSPAACVFPKRFWHQGREPSQPCLIPTATPRVQQRRSQLDPEVPCSLSCLSLSPVSSALTKAAIWPGFLLFFLLLSGSKKQILTHFPRPWDFSQLHTVYACHGFLGSCGVPAPHSQKTGRWGSSSAPLLSKQIPPGSTTQLGHFKTVWKKQWMRGWELGPQHCWAAGVFPDREGLGEQDVWGV